MDAFAIGMTTSDEFGNADVIYEESLPRIRASLTRQPGDAHEVSGWRARDAEYLLVCIAIVPFSLRYAPARERA